MSDINDAVAFAFANSYSGSGDWLNEGTGGSAHDASIDGATHTNNAPNDYFDFDGTNDRITIPDHADLDMGASDSWTWGVACFDTDWNRNSRGWLIGKGFNVADANGSWDMSTIENAQTARAGIRDAAGNPVDTSGSLSDSTIITLIGVRNVGDDDIEIFVDGTGTGSPATDTTTGSLANAFDVTIGAGGNNNTTDNWTGRIMSYCIIPGLALSDADVLTLHSQLINQTAPETDLVGFWGMRAASWILAGTSGLWLPSHASDLLDLV